MVQTKISSYICNLHAKVYCKKIKYYSPISTIYSVNSSLWLDIIYLDGTNLQTGEREHNFSFSRHTTYKYKQIIQFFNSIISFNSLKTFYPLKLDLYETADKHNIELFTLSVDTHIEVFCLCPLTSDIADIYVKCH